jgi:hypothetical protein
MIFDLMVSVLRTVAVVPPTPAAHRAEPGVRRPGVLLVRGLLELLETHSLLLR